MSAPPRGRFISVEGIDGCGKTTIARGVAAALEELGVPVTFAGRREVCASGGFLGDRLARLQELLWEYPEQAPIQRCGDDHWLHLLASWFSLVDEACVRPGLALGRWVIADGWFYKYAARFALKPRFPRERVGACLQHLSAPSTVLMLDVDPRVAFERRSASARATESGRLDGTRGDRQGFVGYQERVRAILAAFARRDRWEVLDGTWPEMVLVDRILGHLFQERDHERAAQVQGA